MCWVAALGPLQKMTMSLPALWNMALYPKKWLSILVSCGIVALIEP